MWKNCGIVDKLKLFIILTVRNYKEFALYFHQDDVPPNWFWLSLAPPCHFSSKMLPAWSCSFLLAYNTLLVAVDCSVDCVLDFAHGFRLHQQPHLCLLHLWINQRSSLWPCPSYLTFYCTARVLLASLITLCFPLVDLKSHISHQLQQGYSNWRNFLSQGPCLI